MWNSAFGELQVSLVKEEENSAVVYGEIMVDKREVT
jgi:hypothetical protein